MIAAIAALVLGSAPADVKTVELFPSDDIWVYPHASDPAADPYLRVWGAGGQSVARMVAESPDDLGEFSYSFLRWKLGEAPKGKLIAATLVVTVAENPAYTSEQAKLTPIEVRPMPSGFSEKGWEHKMAFKLSPVEGAKAPFALGFPEKIEKDKATRVELDLLKGPGDFATCFKAAAEKGELALALTSAIDAAERAVYKLYSKDGPKEHRPYLRLKIETD